MADNPSRCPVRPGSSETFSEGACNILEVAIRLFAEHGVEGVSISRIAREAGVGKATVFHHFPSKDALHRAVLWQVNQRVLWLVEDRSWEAGTLEDCMAGFIRDQLQTFEHDGDHLLRLVRREMMAGNPESLAQISEMISEPFTRLRGHLERRQEKGDLPAGLDVNLLAWLLMKVGVSYHEGRGVLTRIPGFDLAVDPDRFSRLMAKLLINGCLSEACCTEPQDSNPREKKRTADE
ncbi:AcrR family transcriptional regulator [Natronospira proteinivora]|uniref:AcrR family transcriptional regulator n=1 Tax=Natronospira proteinivora TaxID=1807133 RepID=A0ABT1G777_9GAMM|nr:TetR/AcrR family transcriptional regulator [Natronospira proteinivora]MCP1727130.1 AcrR family transcriptional regulator [Natronospira proteinivora]